jgi:tetratricopeptide (TPR) repeat protein
VSDRLLDPFSPIQSTDDADDAYSAVHMAAQSGDANLAITIANGLLESTWTREEHRAATALAVGRVLMGVQRYDEARAWLQLAATGEPDTAEQAYNELAELARWQGVSGHDVDTISGPHRHLRAAKEALDRQDFGTAVDAAVKVFEYDESTTNDKAMASLLAAVALHHQGHDDQADLYAGWAEQHGDAEQKSEAQSLRARWAGIEKADRSIDDGVTAKEVAAVIEAAELASSSADWERTIGLLRELLAGAPTLDAAQSDRVHSMLGDALRSTQRYAEAITEYEQVRNDESGALAYQLKDLRAMVELGEQLGS